MILSVELFGAGGLAYFTAACAVCSAVFAVYCAVFTVDFPVCSAVLTVRSAVRAEERTVLGPDFAAFPAERPICCAERISALMPVSRFS